jgi:hypothetical protein
MYFHAAFKIFFLKGVIGPKQQKIRRCINLLSDQCRAARACASKRLCRYGERRKFVFLIVLMSNYLLHILIFLFYFFIYSNKEF